MNILWKIFRYICYLALLLVIIGGLSLFLPFLLDLCKNQSGATIKCTDPIYRNIFEFGFTVVMMSIFTGLPLLLALIGAGLGIYNFSKRNK